jgi:hypothetical protein
MSHNCNMNLMGTMLGMQYSGKIQRTTVGGGLWIPTVLPGLLTIAWTKDGAGAAHATMAAGHGLQDNDVVDLFWYDAAGLPKAALGVDVQMTGDAAVFSGGYAPGDGNDAFVYPDTDADNVPLGLVVCKTTVQVAPFGANLKALLLSAVARSAVALLDGSGTVLRSYDLAAGEFFIWNFGANMGDSPCGTVAGASFRYSCGNAVAGGDVTIGVMYDS